MKNLILVLILFVFSFSEVHVFWYKALKRNYDLNFCSDSKKGPCLLSNATIHEGMIATAELAYISGSTTKNFRIGAGPTGDISFTSFIWSRDLGFFTGSVTSAKFRVEYADTKININDAGPINIRCGVVDFEKSINVQCRSVAQAESTWWDGGECIPEDMQWMDFNQHLTYDMPILATEEIIPIIALEGRPSNKGPSVLDSQFFEIDITDQINWILSHTGINKGIYSGQYAIVFCVPPNQGNTGMVGGFAREDSLLNSLGVPNNPWTKDGNTAHIVLSGNLTSTNIEKKPAFNNISVSFPKPNPFDSNTKVLYNLMNQHGILSIFDINGKLMLQRQIIKSGEFIWKTSDISRGLYFLKIQTKRIAVYRKLICIK
jgi:hypothetical protein